MATEFGNKRPSQAQRVLEYMRTHRTITQKVAMDELAVSRLSSRICELKEDGHNIIREIVVTKNRYGDTCRIAEYRLLGD